MNFRHRFQLSPYLYRWLPTPGTILFTLLVAALLLYAQRADAFPSLTAPDTSTSTTTFPYQGRLSDSDGIPIIAMLPMTFRLYATSTGGTALWSESWPSVAVTDGLFNALLGTTTPLSSTIFTENATLWVGIKVGTDSEMIPRVQVGSVPFARQALTIPEQTVTTAHLVDGAVTSEKLALQNGSVCLNAQTEISITAEWEVVPVPGTSLPLSLNAESQILVWTSGTYQFDTANYHIGTALFLDDAELVRTSTYTPFTAWNDFSLTRVVAIPAGTHTLDLRTFAQTPGMITYDGGGLITCLQFLVLN